MTTIEIDLSTVAQARDIHVAFSNALGFPEWYGHNWDAFWDLVSSEHPLPGALTIRGVDHVERVLPAEATKMLACFADYNTLRRAMSFVARSPTTKPSAPVAASIAGTRGNVLCRAAPRTS